MTTKTFIRKTSVYLPLIGIILASLMGFYFFSYDYNFRLVIGIAAASGYVAWGLVYHHIRKDLYLSTILEYIAIACFGVITLFFILFRA